MSSASVSLAVGATAVGLLGALGWLSPRRGWREATGWSRIPEPLRPPYQAPLWHPTPEDPPPKLRWLGHAGFLLAWRGTRILIDPNLSSRCTVARRLITGLPSARELDHALGPIDGILISHAHLDHLDLPTLSRLRFGRLLAPANCASALAALPRGSCLSFLRDGDRQTVGNLEVVATPARHGGGRMHPLQRTAADGSSPALGWIVQPAGDAAGGALFFAGDTALGPHFEVIAESYHPRVAVLPIGAYLPRWPLKHFHLSPKDAVSAAKTLGAETTVPCHFGTFPLALDPPGRALPRFAAAAARQGLRWSMPRLLESDDLGDTR